ncbi:MAG: RNA polymerase sigma factor [Gemmataceae bacterium]
MAGEQKLAIELSRTGAISSARSVPYRLQLFSSTGEQVREGVIRFHAGERSVELSSPPAIGSPQSRPEIMVLTLESSSTTRDKPGRVVLYKEGGPKTCSDRALLEMYHQGGADEAMEELVRRHHKVVLASSNQILGDWHDAEDVSQMVFVTLAQKPVVLHGSLAAWLHTVARHSALMFLRARKRRQKNEQGAARPDLIPSDENCLDSLEEVALALRRMPSMLSQAVRLRYLEGLSQVEAAEVAGCPRGTLSQRASLGLRWLRHFLGRESLQDKKSGV